MVGAFALPASIPSVSDLLLPLLVGVTEFLLFTILVHQVSPVGLNTLVNTWLIIMASFAFVAELSVLRAWHYYAAGLREDAYSDDLVRIMKQYLRCIARDARGAAIGTVVAATGAGLRITGTIGGAPFWFPLAITLLLILGLRGHSKTAKMWREHLPHNPEDETTPEGSSMSRDLR